MIRFFCVSTDRALTDVIFFYLLKVSVFMKTNIMQTFAKDKNKELAAVKAKNIELQRKKGDLTKKDGFSCEEKTKSSKRHDELRAL